MDSDFKDIELIHQFLNGDISSFEQLVNKYQNYVYSTVMRLIMNKEDAKDITQEIFIKIYSLLKGYNLQHKFKSWLYKISVNHTIDFLRKRKNNRSISIELEKIYEIEQKLVQDKDCEIVLEISRVYEMLWKLSAKYREVLLLKYIEGLEIEQIGEILNITPVTVRVRLHRAIKILQKKL